MKRILFSLILALSLALPAAAQVVEDPSTGASISSGSTISGCNAITAILNVVTGALTCNPASVVNGTVSTAGRSILTIRDTITGASATSNFLNVTGTFPATLSAATNGVYVSATSDNDTQDQFAIHGLLGAGAGLSNSAGVFGENAAVSGLGRFNLSSANANPFGVYGTVTGNSASNYSSGVMGVASGGAGVKFGVSGLATNTSGTATGVFGSTYAGGGATNYFGGYFVLSSGQATIGTGIAALVADNGPVAANIFEARDNGTAVFTIADGGQVQVIAGASGAPAIKFATGTNAGFYNRAANRITVTGGGAQVIEFDNSAMYLASGTPIYFLSGALGTGIGTAITQETTATVQLGEDVNGAPVNQTLKAHDGITGTDVKGASLTLSPGLGTGAAVSNPLTLNRVVTKATGTTAQTYSPAMVVCPTKILSNTSATAQTIATITTTSTTGGAVTVDYSVVANNGTLQDTDSGVVKVAWNNNAGTVAATMSAVALQTDSDASGTLATTPTATVATNVVSIKFTPTWVTIVPTTVTGWATFTIHSSGDTVACQ